MFAAISCTRSLSLKRSAQTNALLKRSQQSTSPPIFFCEGTAFTPWPRSPSPNRPTPKYSRSPPPSRRARSPRASKAWLPSSKGKPRKRGRSSAGNAVFFSVTTRKKEVTWVRTSGDWSFWTTLTDDRVVRSRIRELKPDNGPEIRLNCLKKNQEVFT